jgi:sialate O-acetylesterase
VKQPVAVRYAWAANPEGANLINSEGLPTSVFRTDNWSQTMPKVTPNKINKTPVKSR